MDQSTLIITSISPEEVSKGLEWGSLYVLYKNENGEIEIGIPDMIEYFSTIANMSGFDEATEKVLFYNGGSNLAKFAPYINDRPVYSIQPSDNWKVEIYDIINNSDVELLDVLDGNFKVDSDNIEEIKQLKYI